mmetsp:Transcript_24635/g.39037  ORF Transcript_24635/g.39037 Transcript_24635/m.39037 type:complete len:255 (+) Transcript_24635:63-827(+)
MAEQKEQTLKLYNNPVCPFGERAWATITVKNIPHEFVHCDINNKSDEFKEAYSKALGHDDNNAGKVPIIKTVDGKYITESAVVARYLDYVYSDEDKYGPPLLPKEPFERAAVESMIDWFGDSGWIRLHYGILFEDDKAAAEKKAAEWKTKWKILNERLGQFSQKGTYLGGDRVSLFEVHVIGFFERLVTIEHFHGYDILNGWMKEYPRIQSWWNTVKEIEGFKKTMQSRQFLVDAYTISRNKRIEARKSAAKSN